MKNYFGFCANLKKKSLLSVTLLWTVVFLGSVIWNLRSAQNRAIGLAKASAESIHNVEMAYRNWNVSHGGVYVPVTEDFKANPYLNIPGRDVKTEDGMELTLVNPAYMTRSVHQLGDCKAASTVRIMGHDPLNPDNAPQGWEVEALERLAAGEGEYFDVTNENGEKSVSYMKPLVMGGKCIECHHGVDDKIGLVHGGIGISLPLEGFHKSSSGMLMSITHGIVWLLGLVIIFWDHSRLFKQKKLIQEREELLLQSEKRLQDINLCSGDWIWETDAKGNYSYISDGIQKVLGYTKDELIGKTPCDLMCPESSGDAIASLKETTSKCGCVLDLETWNITKDGRKRCFVTNATPILDEESNLLGYRGVNKDITKRKWHEDELVNAQLRLEQVNNRLRRSTEEAKILAQKSDEANRAKSDFLANMSHEIRTPLSGVIGMLDLVLDESLSDTAYNYLRTCKTSADSLLSVINDILDVSKIEAGKMDIELMESSLNNLLIDIESLMSSRAREKGIEFHIEFETLIPENIKTDLVRVRQCLFNLVGNAIKFTAEGYVHLRVSLETNDGSPMVHFNVVDTGIGVSEERQCFIFDKFSQADNSITRKFGGTGLGLAITKELANLLGGELKLMSQEAKGSIFTLIIPANIQVDSQQMIGEMHRSHKKYSKGFDTQLSGNVLIAEDNVVNQKVVQKMLEKLGLQMSVANDGREALEKVKEGDYDLVLMDMHMPNMNGLDATRKLRDLGFDKPVIALTADVMEKDVIKSLDAGCDEHLAKPINREEFIKTLSKYLKKGESASQSKTVDVAVREGTSQIEGFEVTNQDFDGILDSREDAKVAIDWSVISDSFGDDGEMLMDFIEIFKENSVETMQHLQTAIKLMDFDGIELHGHTMKGLFAQVGVNGLRDIAYKIECAGKQLASANVESLYNELEQGLHDLLKTMSQEDWMVRSRQRGCNQNK